eukprot:gene58294-79820_t
MLPFWISVLVRAFSWVTILRRNGVLNSTLIDAGVITEPFELVYNQVGVIIGMVHYMMPFAILLLYANLSDIDQRIIQAARSLGARPATIFWRVWLPLSLPGLAIATLFIVIFSFGFLVTPAILGAGRVLMIAEYISVQISSTLRWGVATALSTCMLAVVAGDAGGLRGDPEMSATRLAERHLPRIAAWLLIGFLFLPILVVIAHSFWTQHYLTIDRTFTLENYRVALTEPIYRDLLW